MARVSTGCRPAPHPRSSVLIRRLTVLGALAGLALLGCWGCQPLARPWPAGELDLLTLVARGSRIAVGLLALWVLGESLVAVAGELVGSRGHDPLPRGPVARWVRLVWRGTTALTLLTPLASPRTVPSTVAVTTRGVATPAAGRTEAPPVLVLLPESSERVGPPPSPDATAAVGTAPSTELTWTIRRGEHLWGIAEQTLTWALGEPPDDATTARYHRALIAANREVLPLPDEPDLVFPGQVVVLPSLDQVR